MTSLVVGFTLKWMAPGASVLAPVFGSTRRWRGGRVSTAKTTSTAEIGASQLEVARGVWRARGATVRRAVSATPVCAGSRWISAGARLVADRCGGCFAQALFPPVTVHAYSGGASTPGLRKSYTRMLSMEGLGWATADGGGGGGDGGGGGGGMWPGGHSPAGPHLYSGGSSSPASWWVSRQRPRESSQSEKFAGGTVPE